MFRVQRRQEEGEGYKFTHWWDTSPWVAADKDAGLPQNPSESILASDSSELTHRTPSKQHLPQLSGKSSALLLLLLCKNRALKDKGTKA